MSLQSRKTLILTALSFSLRSAADREVETRMLGSETDSPLTTERQGLFKKKKKKISGYVSTSTNQSYQFKHQENIISLKKSNLVLVIPEYLL